MSTTLPSRILHAKLGGTEADIAVINHSSNAVPTGHRYVITHFTVVNNGTAGRTFLLRIVPQGETAGNEHNLFSNQTATVIKAGTTAIFAGNWSLHAGDKVRGACSSANEVTVRADGIDVTL